MTSAELAQLQQQADVMLNGMAVVGDAEDALGGGLGAGTLLDAAGTGQLAQHTLALDTTQQTLLIDQSQPTLLLLQSQGTGQLTAASAAGASGLGGLGGLSADGMMRQSNMSALTASPYGVRHAGPADDDGP